MKRATPELKELARRLLAYEAPKGKSMGATGSAAFRVSEKLRLSLGKFFGTAGFSSLVSRALALGSLEVSWLGALQIKADGSIEGLEEAGVKVDKDQLAAGETVLLAQLLGLLMIFIGPVLTSSLMFEIWPKGRFDDLDFGESE
jgi:hypothetical protein